MNAPFTELAERILAHGPLPADEAYALGRRVADAQGDELAELAEAAKRVKEARFGKTMSLCSIVNAKSGRCSEDCKFCAQSAHHDTRCQVYPFIDVDKVLDAARAMRAAGASRFAVVTSGKGPNDEDFDKLLLAIRGIRELDLMADASVGILSPERLLALKDAGLTTYHHNLETARSYFPQVCTTHAYDEDVATVRAALAAGLEVCSGGLFGLGEDWQHRVELALELRGLGVHSVPVNFLTPIPGTPYEHRPVMPPEEAIRILALLRLILPEQQIRICGGRPAVFGSRKAEALTCGASGLMIGDYLTTRGEAAASDLDDLANLGLTPE